MKPTVPHRLCGLAARISILAALALPAVGAQGEAKPMTPAQVEAVRILRSLRDPGAPGAEVTGPRIAALGSEVIDELFSILETRRVPGIEETGPQQLSEPQTEAILRALEQYGRGAVLPRVNEHFAAPETPSARAAAIQAIGAVSKANDLELLCAWTRPGEEELEGTELDRTVSAALRRATTSTLRRDPKGFHLLQAVWSGLPEEVLPELVLAVGATGDSRGLSFFAEVYRWNSELRYLVTTQIPLMGPADSGEVNRSLAEEVRAVLRDDEEKMVSSALLALGQLEDPRCVPQLIDLLSDPRPGVHRNAHWALTELTGQQHPPAIELWKHWYTGQLRWHEHAELATLATFRDRDSHSSQVLTALRAVATHRLHRHEMALHVAPLLYADEEEVRRAACEVLADLDSRWAVADLIQGLSDPSEAVRRAASRALSAITGERRGAEMEAWQDYRAPAPGAF